MIHLPLVSSRHCNISIHNFLAENLDFEYLEYSVWLYLLFSLAFKQPVNQLRSSEKQKAYTAKHFAKGCRKVCQLNYSNSCNRIIVQHPISTLFADSILARRLYSLHLVANIDSADVCWVNAAISCLSA